MDANTVSPALAGGKGAAPVCVRVVVPANQPGTTAASATQVNDTRIGVEPLANKSDARILAGIEVVGGAVEVAAGAVLAVATGWTGIGAVAGGAAIADGGLRVAHGMSNIVSGQKTDGALSQVAQAFGVPAHAANRIDAGFGLAASVATGGVGVKAALHGASVLAKSAGIAASANSANGLLRGGEYVATGTASPTWANQAATMAGLTSQANNALGSLMFNTALAGGAVGAIRVAKPVVATGTKTASTPTTSPEQAGHGAEPGVAVPPLPPIAPKLPEGVVADARPQGLLQATVHAVGSMERSAANDGRSNVRVSPLFSTRTMQNGLGRMGKELDAITENLPGRAALARDIDDLAADLTIATRVAGRRTGGIGEKAAEKLNIQFGDRFAAIANAFDRLQQVVSEPRLHNSQMTTHMINLKGELQAISTRLAALPESAGKNGLHNDAKRLGDHLSWELLGRERAPKMPGMLPAVATEYRQQLQALHARVNELAANPAGFRYVSPNTVTKAAQSRSFLVSLDRSAGLYWQQATSMPGVPMRTALLSNINKMRTQINEARAALDADPAAHIAPVRMEAMSILMKQIRADFTNMAL